MKRGDLLPVVLAGAYGKPRPALVIQSFRITVEPSVRNGLLGRSQIMVDKAHTIPRDKAGETFGALEARTMTAVNRALAVFLGLG
jgi:mRNA interferase MazF